MYHSTNVLKHMNIIVCYLSIDIRDLHNYHIPLLNHIRNNNPFFQLYINIINQDQVFQNFKNK